MLLFFFYCYLVVLAFLLKNLTANARVYANRADYFGVYSCQRVFGFFSRVNILFYRFLFFVFFFFVITHKMGYFFEANHFMFCDSVGIYYFIYVSTIFYSFFFVFYNSQLRRYFTFNSYRIYYLHIFLNIFLVYSYGFSLYFYLIFLFFLMVFSSFFFYLVFGVKASSAERLDVLVDVEQVQNGSSLLSKVRSRYGL